MLSSPLWLISLTLIIWFSQNTFYWLLPKLCLWFVHRNYSFKVIIFVLIMLRTWHKLGKIIITIINYWRVQNNVGSHLRRKLCAVKSTILGERHQVLSICLSRFSNTQSILLTSNFSHSVELWLISSTLTIWFSLNTFYWPLPDLCCACY